MGKGIAVAGSVIVDKINMIKAYPNIGELTQIKGINRAVGGLVPNVGIDLKKIDGGLKVYACGKIGKDEEGVFVKSELSGYGLDVSGLIEHESIKTSFTDVMSVMGGERTFFNYAGASAEFGADDVDFNKIDVNMLHLGYFLLLDKVDNGDGLKILKKAKEKGIKTSIDLVSENSDRYKQVLPCLPFVDNLIINEIEGGNLAGIEPKKENVRKICEKLKELGVKDRVIIHLPEFGACLSEKGYMEIPSFDLPKDYVKGSTGAGDAFCAGSLYGIYKGYSDKEILEFASMCAAVSLRVPDAVSGVTDEKEIRRLCKKFTRKRIS